MKKKLVAGMILLGTVVSFAVPLTGNAEEVLDVQRELQYVWSNIWSKYRGYDTYDYFGFKTNYPYDYLSYYVYSGFPEKNWATVRNIEIKKGRGLSAGTKTLTNDLSEPQTLVTDATSVQFQNTMSSATTAGLNIGFSATTKAKFLIGSVTSTLSVDFNFSNTETTTKTETTTYTCPSQSITVPAKKTYVIEQTLEIGNAQAQVDLYSRWKECRGFYEISDWKYNYITQGTEALGDLLQRLQRDYPGIHPQLIPEDNTTIVAKGAGIINYEYGTNFIVRIYEREEVKGRSARSLQKNKLVKEYAIPAVATPVN